MTTRVYYIPCDQVSKYVINIIVTRIGCSIGDFKVNRRANVMRFSITCNPKDITQVERILRQYDMIGD